MPKTRPIADQLRTAIRRAERSGVTRYQIAKKSGISQAQLSRIVYGECDPKTGTVDAILKVIGHTTTIRKK